MDKANVLNHGNNMTKKPAILLRPNPNGDWPQVDPTAYIDPTAQVIGNVHIGARVYVGPYAVVRADESDDKGQVQPIDIRAQCNIQDSVIIHAHGGSQVTIDHRTSLAHGCIIHGPCTIGQSCFIGFRAVVYKAALGDGVFINAGAVIQGVDLAANVLVPAGVSILCAEDVKRQVTKTSPTDSKFMEKIIATNLALTKGYLRLDEQKVE
jgi:carbonic anhydrase/acetyltransferase-like protein (isoleucine patch superfamily)